MKKVLIAGAGSMGLDIAQVFATKDFTVEVFDISEDILEKARNRVNKNLSRQVEKGKLDEDARSAIIGRLSFTSDIMSAQNANLVIEAIIEDFSIKKDLFQRLDSVCSPETVFASNTSSFSITALGAVTKRQDKFVGMHFFNPATIMKLVEVIRGANTSNETFETTYNLCETIGKQPIEVKEAPGFVVNKILVPMINEAVCLLETGVASAEDIDRAMQLGANHPIGPLALGDLIGLDVCLAVMDTLLDETGDPKYRSSVLLRKMVRGGMLGRKTGKGFFEY